MKRIWKPISYFLAAIYFCVDFVFVGIASPISRWIARHFEMPRLRAAIRSLPPYPSLALFSVPVVLLEPVKYLAAYMVTSGKFISAVITFIVGELLKLVIIERLFDLTRDKLMKISAFARLHGYYAQLRIWVSHLEAVQAVRSLSRSLFNHMKIWRDAASRRMAWHGQGSR